MCMPDNKKVFTHDPKRVQKHRLAETLQKILVNFTKAALWASVDRSHLDSVMSVDVGKGVVPPKP